MKLNSPLFDRVRVKPDEDRRLRARAPACDWPGCAGPATHRAPKGRDHEGEYWRFCLDHVRDYNQSYNYFAGMSDDAVAAWQKAAQTGHRPTWKIGINGFHAAAARTEAAAAAGEFTFGNPFRTFEAERVAPDGARGRTIRNGERKALAALGLDEEATRQQIKARFKELAKRHHPDANGGDTSAEAKLREVIDAYNYLKGAGLC